MSRFLIKVGALSFLFAAAGTGHAANEGINFKGSSRLALVYDFNGVRKIESMNINKYDRADGASATYEIGMPFSLFTQVNYFQNRNVKVNWKGTPDTPVQLYGYTVDLGIKATLPFRFFQPWVGGGYGWGVLTYSNPEDREFNNFMIAVYSRGSRSTYCPFGTGGIDFAFGTSGIRLAYSVRDFKTKKSSVIGDEPYNMRFESIYAGFWVNLDRTSLSSGK